MQSQNPLMLEASQMHDLLIQWRRALHQIPEVGTDLPLTMDYIRNRLEEMGISCQYHEAIYAQTAMDWLKDHN